MKVCSTCRVEKDDTAFNRYRDGLQPRCRECQHEHNHRYHRERQRTARPGKHYSRYRITAEEKQAILDRQGGCCAVCGTEQSKRWYMDHDHACCPGRTTCGRCTRGVVCGCCNSRLGYYERVGARYDAAWNEHAVEYLAVAR